MQTIAERALVTSPAYHLIDLRTVCCSNRNTSTNAISSILPSDQLDLKPVTALRRVVSNNGRLRQRVRDNQILVTIIIKILDDESTATLDRSQPASAERSDVGKFAISVIGKNGVGNFP